MYNFAFAMCILQLEMKGLKPLEKLENQLSKWSICSNNLFQFVHNTRFMRLFLTF